MDKFDAIVVGGGVVGVTAALALQQRGLQVMLLDQQPVAQGCSFGNAGVIVQSGFPFNSQYGMADLPGLFLKANSSAALDWASVPRLVPWGIQYARATRPDIVRRNTVEIHELCRDAVSSYERLLGPDLPPMNRRGYLLAHLSPSEVDGAIRLNSISTSFGVAVRMLSGVDFDAKEPALRGLAAGATFFEDAAHVSDPSAFVVRLADVFVRRGGVVRFDRVQRLESKGNGGLIIRGAREDYSPATVVLATGAHANHLLADCGHKIPLVAERGYHLELDVEPGFISRPTMFPGLGALLTPSERGARITSIGHFGSPGFKARPGLLSPVLERVRKLLPTLRPRPGFEVWSGERPSTPDSLPVVEQVPGHRSIFLCAGHGHWGLSFGAVTAGILADLMTGKSSSHSSPLSSQRFEWTAGKRPRAVHSY